MMVLRCGYVDMGIERGWFGMLLVGELDNL